MRGGRWFATTVARDGALKLGFDGADIQNCIVGQLSDTHFYKTMPADAKPGYWQDVYHITYEGQRVYLKLQIVNERAGVVAFKENESGRF